MATVEICNSYEWFEVFSHIDFEDDDAIDVFTNVLADGLIGAGFEVFAARGQRATFHGWNSANTFQYLNGPVGSFNDLTVGECFIIQECIDLAQERMVEAVRSRIWSNNLNR